ncbi:helix-turn-helix domain-containing protein [Vulcanisaeta souniana]|uniref:helix-turn-helix domain-containing protein n=1 Tax=Vulcanisaeta souniana TaxID=164452 RepID=UPI000A905793|nr:helix-turn-helix domain-containing protein [Vulcanisaeta souniana]
MGRDVLAKVIGVKESILKRIEDGQLIPDIELARKLEKALGISLLRETEDAGTETQKPVGKALTRRCSDTPRERQEQTINGTDGGEDLNLYVFLGNPELRWNSFK